MTEGASRRMARGEAASPRRVSAWAPLRRQPFWVILGASFAMNLGVQYISPLLPVMKGEMHLDVVQVGWLVAAYSLPSLLVTLPLGIAADLWGGKRVLVACSLLFGLSGVAAVWVTDFGQLLVLRVIQGVGNAAMASLTISLLAEGLSADEQALSQSYRVAVSSSAEFVLPLLAGLELAWFGNWHIAFLAFALPCAVGIWAIFGLPGSSEGGHGKGRGKASYGRQLQAALVTPAVAGVTAGGFARWFMKYGYFSYIPLYLASQLHASSTAIGLIVGIPGLLSALAATQAGRFGLGQNGKLALVVSLVVMGAGLPAITLVHSVPAAVAFSVVMGAADGICGPLLNAYISHLPPAAVRTAVVSVSGLIRNAGKAAAPVVAGALVVMTGEYSSAMTAIGLSGVLAVGYLFPFLRPASAGSPRPAGDEAVAASRSQAR